METQDKNSFISLYCIIDISIILCMGLAQFLFKTNEQRKLTELLCVDGLTVSVHELALMSGLPYATTWEVLNKMKAEGLAQKVRKGRLLEVRLREQF